MANSTRRRVALARAAALAVLTWLVLAAWTTALVWSPGPARWILGTQADATARREVNAALGGAGDFLLGTLTLGVGDSWVLTPDEPALSLVGARLGRLVPTVAVALVVAAAVAGPLVVAARRGWRPRLVRTAGYLGAVPAVGWLALWLVAAGPHSSLPSRPVASVVTGVAAGVPLAAVVVRTAARGGTKGRDGTQPRDRSSGAVLDAWLWVTWFVGTVVAVDSILGRDASVGDLLFDAVTQGDVTVFAAAVAALSLPLVVAAPFRDGAWASAGRGRGKESEARGQPTDTGAGSDGGMAPGPTDVLRDDRWLRGGLAAFGALLVVGVVGALVLSPPRGSPQPRSAVVPATLLARLGTVTVVAGLAAVVGASVGVPLGVLGSPSWRAGAPVRVVDVATNLPLVVLAVLALGLDGPGPGLLDADLLVGVVAGLAVASLVLRTTEREFVRTGDWRTAAVPAAGVAATGGVVVAFLVAQLSVVGVPLAGDGRTVPLAAPSRFAVETLVPVALPALALLVVGERLRTVGG